MCSFYPQSIAKFSLHDSIPSKQIVLANKNMYNIKLSNIPHKTKKDGTWSRRMSDTFTSAIDFILEDRLVYINQQ